MSNVLKKLEVFVVREHQALNELALTPFNLSDAASTGVAVQRGFPRPTPAFLLAHARPRPRTRSRRDK